MMFLLKSLVLLNTFILRIGRHLAWIAIGLMVVIILVQVLFRYGLNSALPWPDEAARFLMLWMTGLIAPSAYRWRCPAVTPALCGGETALSTAFLCLGCPLAAGQSHVAALVGEWLSNWARVRGVLEKVAADRAGGLSVS